MGKKSDFECIIIGYGVAGRAAASVFIEAKKKILIVDENFSDKDREFLETSKIDYVNGFAELISSNSVKIEDKNYTAKNIILATGSKYNTEKISGLEENGYFTFEDLKNSENLPEAAVIIGGGANGCKSAEYLVSHGSSALIIEMTDRLMSKEDSEIGELIEKRFSENEDITIIKNARVIEIDESSVIFLHEGQRKAVNCNSVVVANGKTPRLDSGLDNAKVRCRNSGIEVDKNLQTSVKNIYAIGAAISSDCSSEKAYYEGVFVAKNIILHTKNLLNYNGICKIIDVSPEVAIVGLSEDDLIRRDKKYSKSIVYFDELEFAENKVGFVKILADKKNNHIFGATIMGDGASYMIQEISLAIRHNLTALEIASTPHPVFGINSAVKIAARKLINK